MRKIHGVRDKINEFCNPILIGILAVFVFMIIKKSVIALSLLFIFAIFRVILHFYCKFKN